MPYTKHPSVSAKSDGFARRAVEANKVRRATEQLLGICNGLIADAHLNETEILFLRTWLGDHPEVVDEWPGRAIKKRLDDIIDDGFVSAEEATDLLTALGEIVKTDFVGSGSAAPESPTFPVDDDPSIFFKDMTFCLTGRFMWGTRASCERVILNLNGTVTDTVTTRLDYLVVGTLIEPQWAHSSFGNKIRNAVNLRDKGNGICIVSEEQWVSAINDALR